MGFLVFLNLYMSLKWSARGTEDSRWEKAVRQSSHSGPDVAEPPSRWQWVEQCSGGVRGIFDNVDGPAGAVFVNVCQCLCSQ